MNKVTNVELIGEVVVITTEGYLNKDLGELPPLRIKHGLLCIFNKAKSSSKIFSLRSSSVLNLLLIKFTKIFKEQFFL